MIKKLVSCCKTPLELDQAMKGEYSVIVKLATVFEKPRNVKLVSKREKTNPF